MIALFELDSKHSAEVQASASKHKKAVIYPGGNTGVK